jgi:DMSO/TMAO reductase YedYZ molybdopterin-dependent catalytic subunit
MLFEGNERKELEKRMREEGRLPSGQAATLKWPVLHYGSVPRFDPGTWDFRVYGNVDEAARWSWIEFNRLPKSMLTSDFHCVTRWSRFDNHWEGVRVIDLLKLVRIKPDAKFVLVHAEQGYTANLPLEDLTRDTAILATHHDGQPLSVDHGCPLRLVVPHLYGRKSVKWVRGFEMLERNVAGFWEQNGYHIRGDPWNEQRFSGE